EAFDEIDLGGGNVAFRTYDGLHYLSARLEPDLGGTVSASADRIQGWETFKKATLPDGRVLLTAANGKQVSAINGGGGKLVANTDNRDAWETFTRAQLGPIFNVAAGADESTLNALVANQYKMLYPRLFRASIDV